MKTFYDYYCQNRSHLEAALFDVDGTLIDAYGTALPNAVKIIDTLNHDHFPYFIFTNGVSNSCRQRAEQLQQSGLEISEEHIISSGTVLTEYLQIHNYSGQTFFQCGELGNPNFAEQAGVHTVRSYRERHQCIGVILGGSTLNNRSEFEAALNFMMEHPDAPFIVANPDRLWGAKSGIRIGDGSIAGFIVSLLKEFNIHIEPVFLGKPHAPLYQFALRKIAKSLPGGQCHPERVIALGDYPPSDVAGANNHGLISGLVLSGMSQFVNLSTADNSLQPKEIFDSL